MNTDNQDHSFNRPSVVIIGAGVAGLACAYILRESGRRQGLEPDLTVLEALNEPGGATRTDHLDGYTCEWGPNGFLDNEPATLKLIEALGLTGRLMVSDPAASRRFIYHSGRLREMPLSPPAFLKSDILPVGAKLRMALELFIPPLKENIDETVDAFGRRRLGQAFATYLLDPMVSGIFAGNSRELSLAAVFPKMVEMERCYGGLFRAMFAKKREAKKAGAKRPDGPAGPGGRLHTFRGGMGLLTDCLAAELADVLITSAEAKTVRYDSGTFTVSTGDRRYDAQAVILACPSHAAASVIRELSPAAAGAAADIRFAPVSVVCHGHREENLDHDLAGFGVLVPRVEGIRSLGSLWSDSIFPGQAPAGHHLLRTMIGGAHDPGVLELGVTELHGIAHSDHNRLVGTRAEPVFKHHFIHPSGIAQYTRGHLARVGTLNQLEMEMPGLYFTGASYRGVSVNGCVKDAYRINDLFWEKLAR